MNNCKDFYFTPNKAPCRLRVRFHAPDTEIKAVVQIVHGIAEHCVRYDEFCDFLCDNGFAVYTSDLRGHGESCGEQLGFFAEKDGWMTVVGDQHEIHMIAKKEYPNVPHILFGHSMGSFLSRTLLFTYPDDFDAAIICGTAQMPKALVNVGYITAGALSMFGSKKQGKVLNSMAFGTYNNHFKPTRTNSDWITRDEKEVDKYIADPLCGFIPTTGMFKDLMYGLKLIGNSENLNSMKKEMPMLFIAGDKDPVGDCGNGVKRAYEMYRASGMEDVNLKLYKDARHELLNEINRHEVFDDILSWINEKI